MVVLILERVSTSLRGELSRWMLEPKAGVFVGNVSALVRDKLWEKACREMQEGAGMLVHSTDSEQGLAMRVWGMRDRTPIDYEGLTLIRRS